MSAETAAEGANTAYLLLGSNIRAEDHLPAAVCRLQRYGSIAAVSRVWETRPVGCPDQPNFLNAAVKLLTPLNWQLLREEAIATIEAELQRVREPGKRNTPRTIDIDIILFNRDVFRHGRHQIPDPELLQRAYIAVPLAEIAPHYVHPENGRTLAEIAAAMEDGKDTFRQRPDVRLADLPGTAILSDSAG